MHSWPSRQSQQSLREQSNRSNNVADFALNDKTRVLKFRCFPFQPTHHLFFINRWWFRILRGMFHAENFHIDYVVLTGVFLGYTI